MTLGSFCVIQNDKNEVLLCHRRDKDLWNLPGGKVEENEAPWEAAVREAQEEIGLDVVIEKLIGCYFKEESNDLVFMFYVSLSKDQQPRLTDEADDIQFFPIDSLPTNTSPKQRLRLLKCFHKDVSWPILELQ